MEEPAADEWRTPVPPRRSVAAVLVVSAALGGLALLAWGLRGGNDQSRRVTGAAQDRSALSSLHDDPYDSPYLNAKPGVAYVGDEACARCHPSIAATFAKHPMGRSLRRAQQPPPGSGARAGFSDQGLDYTIDYKDGTLTHNEARRDGEGRVIAARAEIIDYVVGSGRGGESYFFERDGFLFQSPISWYTDDQNWHLAPGYEHGNQHFERPATEDCLYCHANRVHLVDGTTNRYRAPTFEGMAVGCERCHGPGALHVARQQVVEGRDLTIVNPHHLDRVRRDSVCQQCHLKGEIRIVHAGRDEFDFRPGLPLHRFWSVFVRPDKLVEKIDVVGHFEQMEASRCYQASNGKLGCTSCHDPHRRPSADERIGYYRERCLECHAERGCSLVESTRRARSPNDSCIDCHMPRMNAADIAHAATTLHRIPRSPDDPPQPPEKLRGVSAERDFIVHFQRDLVNEHERASVARDRAVALASLAWDHGETPAAASLAAQALPLLERSLAAHPDDQPAREAKGLTLIRLGRFEDALAVFRAVRDRDPDSENATGAAAALAAHLGRRDEAVDLFKRVLEIDPWSSQRWSSLAGLHAQAGAWPEAAQAAERALRLNPLRTDARKLLVEALARTGKPQQARNELKTLVGIDPALEPALTEWYEHIEKSLSEPH